MGALGLPRAGESPGSIALRRASALSTGGSFRAGAAPASAGAAAGGGVADGAAAIPAGAAAGAIARRGTPGRAARASSRRRSAIAGHRRGRLVAAGPPQRRRPDHGGGHGGARQLPPTGQAGQPRTGDRRRSRRTHPRCFRRRRSGGRRSSRRAPGQRCQRRPPPLPVLAITCVQIGPDLVQAMFQPPADGPARDALPPRDLRRLDLLGVTQQHRRSVRLLQPGHRLGHQPLRLMEGQQFLGRGQGALLGGAHTRGARPPAAHAAGPHARQVAQHLGQPRAQRPITFGPRAHRRRPGLLHQILRGARVDQPTGQALQPGRMRQQVLGSDCGTDVRSAHDPSHAGGASPLACPAEVRKS